MMEFTEGMAKIVLEMELNLLMEGIGPENKSLLSAIGKEWPELKEEYALNWDSMDGAP